MKNITILGMDVSTKSTGWSVVKIDKKGKMKLVDYGLIERHTMLIAESLVWFEKELMRILDFYCPDVISAEAPFVGSNRVTIQRLANFHGVMLMTLEKYKIPIVYYSVMTLKSKILGGIKKMNDDGTKKDGQQMKQEVQDKVIEIFGKENFVKEYNDDVTDSISAAVVYVYMDGKEIEKKKKTRKKSSKK